MIWTSELLSEVSRGYQAACILAAAAELNLFSTFSSGAFSAAEAAQRLSCDLRGITVLLDALTALQLLKKDAVNAQYEVPSELARLLNDHGPGSQLAMAQHQGSCLRRWGQLAAVVKSGRPAERQPSIRGPDADYAAFIEAMDNICNPVADKIVADLGALSLRCLLDVGGATGTWTIAFLRRYPGARAILFDLPQVIDLAEVRLGQAGVRDRVELVAGDFYRDPLPRGADVAWVSAIAHQNSRAQNRKFFSAVASALPVGGVILIRDMLMEQSRVAPVAGALFAVNMLVATEGGGTFTFDEFSEDLAFAGFGQASMVRSDPGMHAVVSARKK